VERRGSRGNEKRVRLLGEGEERQKGKILLVFVIGKTREEGEERKDRRVKKGGEVQRRSLMERAMNRIRGRKKRR